MFFYNWNSPAKFWILNTLCPDAQTRTHTQAPTHTHTHTHTHTGMYAHTHICTYACRQAGRHRGTHPVHPRTYTHMYGRPKGSKLLLIAVSINYLGKIQFKLSFKAVYYAVKLGVFWDSKCYQQSEERFLLMFAAKGRSIDPYTTF